MMEEYSLPYVRKRQRTETEVSDNLTNLGFSFQKVANLADVIEHKNVLQNIDIPCSCHSDPIILSSNLAIDIVGDETPSPKPTWGCEIPKFCFHKSDSSELHNAAEHCVKSGVRVPIGLLPDDCLEIVCSFLQTVDISRIGMCNSVGRKFVQDRSHLFSDLYFNTCCSKCSTSGCSNPAASIYPAVTCEMFGHFVSKSSARLKSIQVIEDDYDCRQMKQYCPPCDSSSDCACLAPQTSRKRSISSESSLPQHLNLSNLQVISIVRPHLLSSCLLTSILSPTSNLTNLTVLELCVSFDINIMLQQLVQLTPIPKLRVFAYSYVNQLNFDADESNEFLLPVLSNASACLLSFHFSYLVRLRLNHYIINESGADELFKPIVLTSDVSANSPDLDHVLVIIPLLSCIEIDLSDNEGLFGYFCRHLLFHTYQGSVVIKRPMERLILSDCTELRPEAIGWFASCLCGGSVDMDEVSRQGRLDGLDLDVFDAYQEAEEEDHQARSSLRSINVSNMWSDGSVPLCRIEVKEELKREMLIDWIEDCGSCLDSCV